jgi:hypothetical protein
LWCHNKGFSGWLCCIGTHFEDQPLSSTTAWLVVS